jgi:hypothetical protein
MALVMVLVWVLVLLLVLVLVLCVFYCVFVFVFNPSEKKNVLCSGVWLEFCVLCLALVYVLVLLG